MYTSVPKLSPRSFPTRRSSDLEVVAHMLHQTMPENDVLLHVLASKIEIPEFEPERLVNLDLFVDIERWRFRFVEDRQLVSLNLRSEEHTSELQSRFDLVCRLLL